MVISKEEAEEPLRRSAADGERNGVVADKDELLIGFIVPAFSLDYSLTNFDD